jgi:hypothetical protein
MPNGIDVNQIYLLIILAGAIILLFTEWIRLDLTAILKVLVWRNLMILNVGFDPAQVQSWNFVRSDSV